MLVIRNTMTACQSLFEEIDEQYALQVEHDGRGRLAVEDGNLVFTTAGFDDLEVGAYDIPCQQVSNILLGPGGVVNHDALRILARRDTGLLAVGSKDVRLYAVSMPFGPDSADRARRHALGRRGGAHRHSSKCQLRLPWPITQFF